jgi:hypothetical protein
MRNQTLISEVVTLVVFFNKNEEPSFTLYIPNSYVHFIELPRISQQYSWAI